MLRNIFTLLHQLFTLSIFSQNLYYSLFGKIVSNNHKLQNNKILKHLRYEILLSVKLNKKNSTSKNSINIASEFSIITPIHYDIRKSTIHLLYV